jgi:hypothetical protein
MGKRTDVLPMWWNWLVIYRSVVNWAIFTFLMDKWIGDVTNLNLHHQGPEIPGVRGSFFSDWKWIQQSECMGIHRLADRSHELNLPNKQSVPSPRDA